MIGDVEIPPWADSPHEFIHQHREVCIVAVIVAVICYVLYIVWCTVCE